MPPPTGSVDGLGLTKKQYIWNELFTEGDPNLCDNTCQKCLEEYNAANNTNHVRVATPEVLKSGRVSKWSASSLKNSAQLIDHNVSRHGGKQWDEHCRTVLARMEDEKGNQENRQKGNANAEEAEGEERKSVAQLAVVTTTTNPKQAVVDGTAAPPAPEYITFGTPFFPMGSQRNEKEASSWWRKEEVAGAFAYSAGAIVPAGAPISAFQCPKTLTPLELQEINTSKVKVGDEVCFQRWEEEEKRVILVFGVVEQQVDMPEKACGQQVSVVGYKNLPGLLPTNLAANIVGHRIFFFGVKKAKTEENEKDAKKKRHQDPDRLGGREQPPHLTLPPNGAHLCMGVPREDVSYVKVAGQIPPVPPTEYWPNLSATLLPPTTTKRATRSSATPSVSQQQYIALSPDSEALQNSGSLSKNCVKLGSVKNEFGLQLSQNNLDIVHLVFVSATADTSMLFPSLVTVFGKVKQVLPPSNSSGGISIGEIEVEIAEGSSLGSSGNETTTVQYPSSQFGTCVYVGNAQDPSSNSSKGPKNEETAEKDMPPPPPAAAATAGASKTENAGTHCNQKVVPSVSSVPSSPSYYSSVASSYFNNEESYVPGASSNGTSVNATKGSPNYSEGYWEEEGGYEEEEECKTLRCGGKFTVFDNDVLGSGAFGVVVRGFDNTTGGLVAVKLLKKQDQQTPGSPGANTSTEEEEKARNDLRKEAQLISALDHPNIVRIVGTDLDSPPFCLFMEWMSGGTIHEMIAKLGGKLPLSVAVKYTSDMLKGVAYLHQNKVLHRDLKPHNVLLTNEGTAKVADFGMCRELVHGKSEVTATGGICGTVVYLSPEAIQGKHTAAADIWAVGCTLLQMVTGEVPWSHLGQSNMIALLFAIGNAAEPNHHPAVPFFAEEGGRIDPRLKEVLDATFQKDPLRRPSAEELLQFPLFTGRPASTASPAASSFALLSSPKPSAAACAIPPQRTTSSSPATIATRRATSASAAGSIPVDSEVPNRGDYLVVDDWSITLNQTNIEGNNNKFYLIQVLKSAREDTYYAWNRWGRVGSPGRSKIEPCSSLAGAIASFEKKFREKTLNSWSERSNFKKQDGKYQLVETVVVKEEAQAQQAATEKETPMLGRLSKNQIEKGLEVLDKIQQGIVSNVPRDELVTLSSLFFSLIPHDFGRRLPEPILATEKACEKEEMLKFYLRMGFETVEKATTAAQEGNEDFASPISGVMDLACPATLEEAASGLCFPHFITKCVCRGEALASKNAGGSAHLPCKMNKELYGAILLYTFIYSDLNQVLRDSEGSPRRDGAQRYHKYLRLLFEAANTLSSHAKRRMTLWRGISVDLYESYQVGSTVTWWGVSSCTSDVNVANNFNKSCGNKNCSLLSIETKTACDISEITFEDTDTENDKRKESLLLPGTILNVKSSTKVGDVTVIHMEEVGRAVE